MKTMQFAGQLASTHPLAPTPQSPCVLDDLWPKYPGYNPTPGYVGQIPEGGAFSYF
jgi:hypothetical protein